MKRSKKAFSYKYLENERTKNAVENNANVISLLKFASCPVIQDVDLKWDISGNGTINQVPATLPCISVGDSLTVFAEVKRQEDDITKGTVKLSFVVDAKKYATVSNLSRVGESSFGGESPMGGKSSLRDESLHRCAAKAILASLCEERSQREANKESIIKLSKESGVLSRMTAYVGIDENSKERVKGALKGRGFGEERLHSHDSWTDSSDDSDSDEDLYSCSSSSLGADACFDYTVEEAEEGDRDYFAPYDSRHGANILGFARSVFRKKRSAAKEVVCSSRAKGDMAEERKPQENSGHLSLVTMQSVDGSWSLTPSLATELGIDEKLLSEKTPKYLDVVGDARTVWATVLALVWLCSDRFSKVRLELMLVCTKANDWLEEILRGVANVEEVKKEARKVLKI